MSSPLPSSLSSLFVVSHSSGEDQVEQAGEGCSGGSRWAASGEAAEADGVAATVEHPLQVVIELGCGFA